MNKESVTPCVGVWIETERESMKDYKTMSHPAWVCGLKQGKGEAQAKANGHTLRGCVD